MSDPRLALLGLITLKGCGIASDISHETSDCPNAQCPTNVKPNETALGFNPNDWTLEAIMGCSSGSNVSLEVACSLGGANGMVDVVNPDEAYLRRRLYGTPRRPQQRQPAQRTTRHIFMVMILMIQQKLKSFHLKLTQRPCDHVKNNDQEQNAC